jgi:Fe-S-cluster containining protein
MDLSRERFEVAVRVEMGRRNLTLIMAMYTIYNRWMKNAIKQGNVHFACYEGCGHCCYQMVTCTELEWREIEPHIETIKEGRRDLVRRLLRAQKNWREYCLKRPEILFSHSLQVYRDWFRRPCPFLNQRSGCDIYPVRPIDCRTTHAHIQCEGMGSPNAVRFVFDWELWPNNWILEEQAARGPAATTPLLHWIHLLKIKR